MVHVCLICFGKHVGRSDIMLTSVLALLLAPQATAGVAAEQSCQLCCACRQENVNELILWRAGESIPSLTRICSIVRGSFIKTCYWLTQLAMSKLLEASELMPMLTLTGKRSNRVVLAYEGLC